MHMRLLMLGLVLLGCAGCDFIGGADTLVRGSHNFIAGNGGPDAVADALSRLEEVPQVSDQDILAIYETIRTRALAGELESARVLLRLAAMQRAPKDDETQQ